MNSKKILIICTASLALIAMGIASIPLGISLKPNARAEAALARIDISELKPWELVLREHPNYGKASQDYNWSILFLKLPDKSVKAWIVPAKDGHIGMPDRHWWRPIYPCKKFSLSQKNGQINNHSLLRCHDINTQYEWLLPRWQWNLNGKAIDSSAVEDMPVAVGVIKGKYFIVGKRS